MTPPTPFEKALDEIIDDSIVALTEYTDNGEGVISYDHVVFDRPKLRQALLAAHRAGLRAARANEAEISRNIMQRYTDLVAKGDFRDWLTSCKEDLLMPQDDRIKRLRDKI